MTAEKHRAVMAGATYDLDLDLLVVAPDGSLAGFTIVWLDQANHIGVFEPLGVHPAHQRRGLGKALLLEASGHR